ncbi:Pyrimidine deoxynucleoside triphosphate (dYTP)pyrophospho hydrolase YfoO [Salmonella enterica subsp. enterica]|nr:Pyrimidine deoxynucleoside triphosphate (dYTP)pyrophospho hydrolase YfoO [Salmonella enterica subsp. enterica]
MRQRTIVCPLIQNDGCYLLCKNGRQPRRLSRSVGAVGRRVEPGERIEEALRREIREELGEQLILSDITPWTFRDDIRVKTYADGRQEEIYMIYLIFDCVSANRDICINDEFQDYAWVKPEELALYDLNVATRHTLALKGLL